MLWRGKSEDPKLALARKIRGSEAYLGMENPKTRNLLWRGNSEDTKLALCIVYGRGHGRIDQTLAELPGEYAKELTFVVMYMVFKPSQKLLQELTNFDIALKRK